MTTMPRRVRLLPIIALACVTGCEQPEKPAVPPLAPTAAGLAAAPRVNGSLSPAALPAPSFSYGTQGGPAASTLGVETGAGPYSLEFADTDIREVVAQILGGLLHVNYSIDPAVHGTVTLHTGQPLTGRQLLPTLQNLLANAGAVLLPDEGLYRVVPATAAGAAGSLIIPLKYVSAEELAKVLQPLAGSNAKVAAESGLNALLISGDPAQVQAVRDLVRTFDTDELANRSIRRPASLLRRRQGLRRRDAGGISRQIRRRTRGRPVRPCPGRTPDPNSTRF